MVFTRKGNVYGVRFRPKTRHHKMKSFHPAFSSTKKSDLYKVLLTYGRNNVAWAHSHYYRIYRHRHIGYTLYMGPPKISHGGIRHRPTRYAQRAKYMRQRYGMLPGDAARNADYISRMEARVNKAKAQARQKPPKVVVVGGFVEREPPTHTEPGDFTGVFIGELPTKEQAEKVKKEDQKEKRKKRIPLSEEEKEERREAKRKRDVKTEAKRHENEIKFKRQRFNYDTPDISPKFLRVINGKYKGRFFQVTFDAKSGGHTKPKQLTKNQFYMLNMNEMNQRGRSIKVKDVNSVDVEEMYKK